jgi:hypothetical protein
MNAHNDPTRYIVSGTLNQRPGLAMVGDIIVTGFGSHCDNFNFTGYVITASKTAGVGITDIQAMVASPGNMIDRIPCPKRAPNSLSRCTNPPGSRPHHAEQWKIWHLARRRWTGRRYNPQSGLLCRGVFPPLFPPSFSKISSSRQYLTICD